MPVPDPLAPPAPHPHGTRRPRLLALLRSLWPASMHINRKEGLRMVVGAALGVLIVALFSRWMGAALPGPWMVAALGASAVLVLGMPTSPMAQPWPVIAGSTLSAMVGAACAALIPDAAVAGSIAVGAAIAVMLALRCLHPPGVSMALYAVLNHSDGVQLAAFPVLVDVLVLVAVGVVYNRLTGRRYPHLQQARETTPDTAGRFTSADLDVALAHYDGVLDIGRADLEGLLQLAGKAAFQRTLGELRCADIMSAPVHAVAPDVRLKDAWALMRKERVKALPVVDPERLVVGIVTVSDFMRLAHVEMHEGIGQRLRSLVMGRTQQPKAVSELMSHPVQTALQDQPVMDLVPLFSEAGHHHIPIVNAQKQLVGIITQTGLVQALARAVAPPP